ncbi:MAG: fatty acid desaturase [Rhodobacteraceae bacterium]|nr:fatty acid desaturase [Paracoccaceae bacterium]
MNAFNPQIKRDYSLVGPNNQRAVELGLASAEWYHSEVPRKVMKFLMKRSDAQADQDTLLWFLLLIFTGSSVIALWGSWWAVPFLLGYGVLYGTVCDSRWHECGHGTAFRTGWKNDAVYHIASFMVMRNPISWRWSHARHHTDTIIIGRDPEIALMRPPTLILVALKFIGLPDIIYDLRALARNSLGIVSEAEQDYIPEAERAKAVFWARIHMGIYATAILMALVSWSILPLLLIGGPRIYGCWHLVMMGLLQHGGLAEDVLDHRLNSRTVYINPVSRWLYWNMNYHVEHHMFPMVPYHALPRLHALIKHDLPAPNASIADAYGDLIYALARQTREAGYTLPRALPPTARPYREEFHAVDGIPSRGAEA